MFSNMRRAPCDQQIKKNGVYYTGAGLSLVGKGQAKLGSEVLKWPAGCGWLMGQGAGAGAGATLRSLVGQVPGGPGLGLGRSSPELRGRQRTTPARNVRDPCPGVCRSWPPDGTSGMGLGCHIWINFSSVCQCQRHKLSSCGDLDPWRIGARLNSQSVDYKRFSNTRNRNVHYAFLLFLQTEMSTT